MNRNENRLYSIVENLISSGMSRNHDIEIMRKVRLSNIISLIGILFLAPFGIVASIQGNLNLGLLDFFAALVLISLMIYLRKSQNYQFASILGISLTGLLFFYLLITGGINNTAFVWYYTFPLVASFLLGSKKGAIGAALLLVFAIIFFVANSNLPYLTHYSEDFLIRFIPSFVVVSIYSYAFEYFREKTQRDLTAKNTELNEAINELRKTETKLRKAQDELERRVRERTAELSNANVKLTDEIEERSRIQDYLASSLKEKEILLKEVYHRVKNNLQVISSLLSLQARQVDDPNVLAALRDSQSRVRSMSLVHEQLYQTSNLGHIDLQLYLQNLTTHLYSLYKNSSGDVSFTVDSDDISLAIDDAIPCGLIVTELVSNSLKYAFPNRNDGEICVKAYHIDDKIAIKISDNGIGLPPDSDMAEIASLGLELVQSLTRQLDGTLKVNPETAAFTLSFSPKA